jgi:hypothetical protein
MNLQALLIKIKATGMTDKEIGTEIGCAPSLVTRLRNGVHKTASYERGVAILKLAKKKLPDFDDAA